MIRPKNNKRAKNGDSAKAQGCLVVAKPVWRRVRRTFRNFGRFIRDHYIIEKHGPYPKPPLRILLEVTRRCPYWDLASSPTEDVLPIALEILDESKLRPRGGTARASSRLLAKHIHSDMILFIFDIFHIAYDAVLAHLPERNHLPVIYIRLGREEGKPVKLSPASCQEIGREVARLHDLHGWGSVPPFVRDYTDGLAPMYTGARSETVLVEGQPYDVTRHVRWVPALPSET